MPKPIPQLVNLTDEERIELEKLVNRHNVGQQIALRGRIVLATSEGKNNSEIARNMKVSLDMVRLWRKRWVDLQAIPLSELTVAERLADLPRPGAPPRITADQICQMVAMACEKPEESERPISQWTGREIADEMIKRGIVEEISPRHAGRLLKRSRSQASFDTLLANTST